MKIGKNKHQLKRKQRKRREELKRKLSLRWVMCDGKIQVMTVRSCHGKNEERSWKKAHIRSKRKAKGGNSKVKYKASWINDKKHRPITRWQEYSAYKSKWSSWKNEPLQKALKKLNGIGDQDICRLRGTQKERVQHLAAGCNKLTSNVYTRRHINTNTLMILAGQWCEYHQKRQNATKSRDKKTNEKIYWNWEHWMRANFMTRRTNLTSETTER